MRVTFREPRVTLRELQREVGHLRVTLRELRVTLCELPRELGELSFDDGKAFALSSSRLLCVATHSTR